MIVINIDVMLARRKMSVTELARLVGITMANISILKNGKAKAVRIETLDKICRALDCQPGDILEYRRGDMGEPIRMGEEDEQGTDRRRRRSRSSGTIFHGLADYACSMELCSRSACTGICSAAHFSYIRRRP